MKNLARAAALSLTTMLALATVSACGSSNDNSSAPATTAPSSSAPATTDSSAPSEGTSTAASGDANALCSAFAAFPTDVNTADTNSVISAAKSYGDQIAAAGIPSDMPADAQTGLKDYVSLLQNLDADKVNELQNMQNPTAIFGNDAAAGEAFFTYIGTACASELGSLGGASTATP